MFWCDFWFFSETHRLIRTKNKQCGARGTAVCRWQEGENRFIPWTKSLLSGWREVTRGAGLTDDVHLNISEGFIWFIMTSHSTRLTWNDGNGVKIEQRTCQLCQIKRTLEPVRVVINSLHMSLCMMLLKRQLRCYWLPNVAINPIPVANFMSAA